MVLDQPTLLFTCAVAIGTTGMLLLLVRRPPAAMDSLLVWGLSMMAGSAGLVLVAAVEVFPWIPRPLPTAVLLAASALSWTAARVFAERRPLPWLIAAGPGLWLGAMPWDSEAGSWIAGSSLIGAGYTAATAAELLRVPLALPSRGAALVLLVAHACLYLIRGAAALGADATVPGYVVDTLLLEGLVHTFGMAFLLIAMVKERDELRSREVLLALARQDGLTGIGNRRHFDEQLAAEIGRTHRRGPVLALLLIDVDRFKAYNDAVGHQMGDACLRVVAQAIASHARNPGDLAARYGGEEFAVVLRNLDVARALTVAERVRAAVEALALPHPGIGGVVTVSVGVAALDTRTNADDGALLVQRADDALYRAKAAGRNTVRPQRTLPLASAAE